MDTVLTYKGGIAYTYGLGVEKKKSKYLSRKQQPRKSVRTHKKLSLV